MGTRGRMAASWNLLDCTLRDGGSTIGFNFQFDVINRVLTGLSNAGIDYVELGYRSGSGSVHVEKPGPTADVNRSFLEQIDFSTKIKKAVMIIPAVAKTEDLDVLAEFGIDLVRIAVYPHNFENAMAFVDAALRLGLECSVNQMASSYMSADDLVKNALAVQECGASVFYFADSYGHFMPEDVNRRVEALKEQLDMEIGFHAHNNLSLGLSNAIAAIRSGADFIDASLCGMGRGAGNVQIELLPFVLDLADLSRPQVDKSALMELSSIIAPLRKNPYLGTAEIISGSCNLHFFFYELIQRASQKLGVSEMDIARGLSAIKPKKVSEELTFEVARQILSNHGDNIQI